MREKREVILTGFSGVVGHAVLLGVPSDINIVKVGRSLDADIRVDLSKEQVDLIHKTAKPDYLIHTAAIVPGKNNLKDNQFSAMLTQRIDNNIFRACKEWQCPVIYASGCSLYQPIGDQKLSEENLVKKNISSPYLLAKKRGEILFNTFKNSTILRISFPVGHGLSSSNVLGNFLRQADKTNKINVFGSGTREQDFIDVRDVSNFINIIVRKRASGIFNVARGCPTTMKALAECIVKLKRTGKVLVGLEDDPLEGVCARFSISKAKEELGWKPKYKLPEILIDHKLL